MSARDADAVVDMQKPVRLRCLTVDVNLAAVARLLRLAPCAKQASNVEPNVQTDFRAVVRSHAPGSPLKKLELRT
jgi:hypothetical protein